MRTITTTIEAYEFEELTEKAKDKAIEKLYDINVSHDWWTMTYEDAERIGLKITGFDVDRGNCLTAKLTGTCEGMAERVIKEHGETCETYKLADAFLTERKKLIVDAVKDEDGEVDNYLLQDKIDELEEEFSRAIKTAYLSILKGEYEYLTSRKAIEETIEANEYEFTKDGVLI